jgi:peptidoglycan/xylan/chitin deacetylase (PgdA/CDA1 family)
MPRRRAAQPDAVIAALLSGCTILRPNAWPAGSGKILLMFDDGPNPEMSPRLLEVLRRHKVPATFCYIGFNVDRSPAVVHRAWTDGHALANHTIRHSAADLLSRRAFER